MLLELALPQPLQKLMVFDEADVGVSGATASLIGSVLKDFAKSTPLVCITHSPQVAAKADHHWYVQKSQHNDTWQSVVNHLKGDAHIRAVAALLGDASITQATLANAKELCLSE